MRSELRPALVLLLVFTVLLGGAYPLLVTGIGRVAFPRQAEGSLLRRGGQVVGSRLIGQSFNAPRYFWGRPSASASTPYDPTASSGSNLGPLNPALLDSVRARLARLRSANPAERGPVPADLVSASGSGLDPDISPAAAGYQIGRVAGARGLADSTVRALVSRHTRGRTWYLLGEPRVNVLELNLDLDALSPGR